MTRPGVAFGMTLPAYALLGLVLFGPGAYGLWFSLQRIEYGAPAGFAGLANYRRLFEDPELARTLLRTIVHTGFSVVGATLIALALALWVHRLPRRAAFVVQMVAILPWIVSNIVAALLFRWVFVNDIGLAGALSKLAGFAEFQPLNSGAGAMTLLIIVSVWKRVGYALLVILAGLKGIPEELEEAAGIDGANAWQTFRYVILPLLKTPLLLVAIVLTLSNVNTVETPLVTTGGGPADATRVLAIDVFERAFTNFDLGSATALALLMFAGNVVLVLAYVRMVRWKA